MKNKTHELKCWPEFYKKIISGEKTFEIRKDDRGYHVGDTLQLREYNPKKDLYSGNRCLVSVPYLIAGPGFGLEAEYVCMSIKMQCEW